jgi:hypothetical protein
MLKSAGHRKTKASDKITGFFFTLKRIIIMNSKYPKKVSELPQTSYYAILTPESTFVEESEAAKKNGYHSHTVESWNIEILEYEEWKKEIVRLTNRGGISFQAVKINPAQVTINVNVGIEES